MSNYLIWSLVILLWLNDHAQARRLAQWPTSCSPR
jgi:hypothetical protein